VCITKTEKAESEAQRGKPKGTLESESRKMREGSEESAHRAVLKNKNVSKKNKNVAAFV
jgi:hypothetical protein